MIVLFFGATLRLLLLALLLILALSALSLSAQEPNRYSFKSFESLLIKYSTDSQDDFFHSSRNGYDLAQSAMRFEWRQYALSTMAFVVAAAAFSADNSVQDLALNNQSSSNNRIISTWEHFGSGATAASIGGGLYLAGHLFEYPSMRETGRQVLTALSLTAVATTTLKIVCGRQRPYTNNGTYNFETFRFNVRSWSFPSGHTATAFALSSVLSSRASNPFATLGFYSLATMTAAQRIYHQKHWFSDVVAGAIIGTTTGIFVSRNSASTTSDKLMGGWEIAPFASAPALGLMLHREI